MTSVKEGRMRLTVLSVGDRPPAIFDSTTKPLLLNFLNQFDHEGASVFLEVNGVELVGGEVYKFLREG